MTRSDSIHFDFYVNERIWPSTFDLKSFKKALDEVLSRLPDDVYEKISSRYVFVCEHPGWPIINVPFCQEYPPSANSYKVRLNIIVLFHSCLAYPHSALVGILAYEIALRYVEEEKDAVADWKVIEERLRNWGFGEELKDFYAERAKARKADARE